MSKLKYKSIEDNLKELSDIELQRKLWLNINNPTNQVSSYDELYCRLFDDNSIEDFIENELINIKVKPKFLFEIKKLIQMLNDFKEPELYQESKNDLYILDNLNWHMISEQSKLVLYLWNEEIALKV